MRRKEEVWRRQEKQTHSEVAEETIEGRNEPLNDWKAIVDDDVAAPLLLEHAALLCLYRWLGLDGRLRRPLLLSVFLEFELQP